MVIVFVLCKGILYLRVCILYALLEAFAGVLELCSLNMRQIVKYQCQVKHMATIGYHMSPHARMLCISMS